MGNYNCCCCLITSTVPPPPPCTVFEISANSFDLLTLHDGLASLFVKGAFEKVVFDQSAVLVVDGYRGPAMAAWIPDSPQAFEDHLCRVSVVSAVLRLTEDEEEGCDVMVVYESAKINLIAPEGQKIRV
jgi:hypothetical protein